VSIYLKDPATRRVGAETKQAIDRVVAELNFRPNHMARSLSRQKSNMVAIILPFNGSLFQNLFINGILGGVQSVLFNRNYNMVFVPIRGEDSRSMVHNTLAASEGFDGYILFGTRYCSRESISYNIKELQRSGSPFVLVNVPELPFDINQVLFRDPPEADPYRYLRERGHRHILLVSGRAGNAESEDCERVFREDAARNTGHSPDEYILNGDVEAAIAKSAMRAWLKKRLPLTAVYCMNDDMASGVYEALREAGLSIPGDVSVVGRNDLPVAAFMQPPLTTVRRQIFKTGTVAAESLLLSMANPGSTRKVTLESELIERKSVARPKNPVKTHKRG
jgi:DNA-binding LacI/PurR family transcriptional regulator